MNSNPKNQKNHLPQIIPLSENRLKIQKTNEKAKLYEQSPQREPLTLSSFFGERETKWVTKQQINAEERRKRKAKPIRREKEKYILRIFIYIILQMCTSAELKL